MLDDGNSKNKTKPSEITVIKISIDSNYLAVGKSNGRVLIYEILNLDFFNRNYDKIKINDNTFFNLLNHFPLKEFKEQRNNIIEICWSFKVKKDMINFLKFIYNFYLISKKKFRIQKNFIQQV